MELTALPGCAPNVCIICDKRFAQVRELNQHKKVHLDSMSYICVCKKLFASQERLDAHSVLHNNDKSFECLICQKMFLRKNELNEHNGSVHKEEKPFACPYCDKTFSRISHSEWSFMRSGAKFFDSVLWGSFCCYRCCQNYIPNFFSQAGLIYVFKWINVASNPWVIWIVCWETNNAE